MKGNIEKLMDNFEEIVTDTGKVNLAGSLQYALSLQFMECLKKNKKID